MADCLVKLYELPEFQKHTEKLAKEDIIIRRVLAYEKSKVSDWVQFQFGDSWASECEAAFSHVPATCFIATQDKHPIGFACYEVTMKNFFGPLGVSDAFRDKGIGTALLLSSLSAMKEMGYAYAIVGGGGDAIGFYRKAVGATLIEGSEPGIYIDRLK